MIPITIWRILTSLWIRDLAMRLAQQFRRIILQSVAPACTCDQNTQMLGSNASVGIERLVRRLPQIGGESAF